MERVLPHDPSWAQAFEEEADALITALRPVEITLHHIGSTAVPGLLAKPIIDILGSVDAFDALDGQAASLVALGYEVMGAFGIEGRRYYRKTGKDGFRTHHLHVYVSGSNQIPRHLAFRDYLRAFPDRAAAYAEVKAAIVSRMHSPELTYAQAKAAMVARLNAEATAWQSGLEC